MDERTKILIDILNNANENGFEVECWQDSWYGGTLVLPDHNNKYTDVEFIDQIVVRRPCIEWTDK